MFAMAAAFQPAGVYLPGAAAVALKPAAVTAAALDSLTGARS